MPDMPKANGIEMALLYELWQRTFLFCPRTKERTGAIDDGVLRPRLRGFIRIESVARSARIDRSSIGRQCGNQRLVVVASKIARSSCSNGSYDGPGPSHRKTIYATVT